MNVLDRFAAAGVQFRHEGERVIARGRITPELQDRMREVKNEILVVLQAIEHRRRRLLDLLAERPEQRYVLIYDTDASTDYDLLAMAIPEATFEVRVPKPVDCLAFAWRLTYMLDQYGAAKA